MIPLLSRLSGYLLLGMAAGLMLPLAVSYYYADGMQYALMLSATIILCLGLMLRNIFGRNADYHIRPRNSFWVTIIVWLIVPLAGTLPYLATGVVSSFTDAAFESFSGFTTTGSSIFPQPQDLPPSILLFRSLTQWVGGLGLVMLLIAILRGMKVGTFDLYSAEFSGTLQRKLHPHIAISIHRMWFIYITLTLLLIGALLLCGNAPITSICIALSTISSGGFMTHSDGAAIFSTASQWVITAFMMVSAINLALLYNFFTFKWRDLHRNEEFRHMVAIFLIAIASATLALYISGNPFSSSIQFACFHIAATISTCGFITTPPLHWANWLSVLTLLLMIIGSSSGSTGGGLKLKRVIILRKYLRNYILRIVHPNMVSTVKIDKVTVSESYINKILAFLFLYFCFVIAAAFLLTLCGYDLPNSITLSLANMSNLGPSTLVSTLGASLPYTALVTPAKWVLMVLMLAGRLEIFVLLAIFSPSYWRKFR